MHDNRIKFFFGVDGGPGDAINKCLELAKGDICNFLGSDDILYDNNVLKKVALAFKNNQTDSVYGNLIFKGNFIQRKWLPGIYKKNSFLNGWQIPFPAFYFKRDLFYQYGGFDTNINISDDFDFTFRLLHIKKIRTYYINETLVLFYFNGRSNKLSSKLKSVYEIYKIFRKYNIKNSYFRYLIKRSFKKINQFL